MATNLIKPTERRAAELANEAGRLRGELERFGWKDDRADRTEERADYLEYDVFTTFRPSAQRVPASFISSVQAWFSACLALMEANMRGRASELRSPLSGFKGDFMTREEQYAAADTITRSQALVSSIPRYIEDRLYDLELMVAQAYLGDELKEADVLLKAGHTRAAGAVAGVLLERHLKTLCTKASPPITLLKSDTISKLNDKLKGASVYDAVQWRKVQWVGDIRNQCDHARTADPRRDDVRDLIAEVRKFVSAFTPP